MLFLTWPISQRQLGPLVHQLDELLVDAVDLGPQSGDRGRARSRRRWLASCRFLLRHRLAHLDRSTPSVLPASSRRAGKESTHLVLGSNRGVKQRPHSRSIGERLRRTAGVDCNLSRERGRCERPVLRSASGLRDLQLGVAGLSIWQRSEVRVLQRAKTAASAGPSRELADRARRLLLSPIIAIRYAVVPIRVAARRHILCYER